MAAPDTAVALGAKFALFEDHFAPKIVAEFNGYHVKVAKLEGVFEWHTHADTDEVFLVLGGELTIEVDGRDPVALTAGDLYVVPRGLHHRPIANGEAQVALIEPAGVPNTGDAATAAEETWI